MLAFNLKTYNFVLTRQIGDKDVNSITFFVGFVVWPISDKKTSLDSKLATLIS